VVFDVAIVGGGLAGSTLASILTRHNIDVVLVEPKKKHPICFKAEKLEPDQWQLLQKHGLLEPILPICEPIYGVQLASEGRSYGATSIRQYGYSYHDLVNAVRCELPGSMSIKYCAAKGIVTSNEAQAVHLDDGSTIKARLVVIATGAFGRLHTDLGLSKNMISRQHSFNFGFDLKEVDKGFSFDSLTYHCTEKRSGADYLTLFKIPGTMRANLFTYWKPGDERVRQLSSSPKQTLLKNMPGLANVLGNFEITSNIDRFAIDLYVADQLALPGVVFVGDAFQSVCPSTGTGLSKVLTDVDVLAGLILNDWLRTPGMSEQKMRAYYCDLRKKEQDTKSLEMAMHRRKVAIGMSDFKFSLERLRNQVRLRRECRQVAAIVSG
jgi:2-polyprenyl-6-methoxyphenol hydroxylase-like FAD-dependent oxidoreductase